MNPSQVTKILIIRFSSMGDIILTTPCVALIRKHFPNAEITYATKSVFAELLFQNPNIDRLVVYQNQTLRELARSIQPSTEQYFDLVIDLDNKLRSRLLNYYIKKKRCLRYKKPYLKRWMLVYFKINFFRKILSVAWQYMDTLKYLGIQPEFIKPQVAIRKPNIFELLNKKHDLSKNILISFAPGAKWFTKRWPLDKFIQVSEHLLNESKVVICFLGGGDEIQMKEKIDRKYMPALRKRKGKVYNLIGKLSLQETSFIISKSKIMLTNDSGLMHIASAFEVKIIALFLSTVAEFGFMPFGKESQKKVISYSLSCKPCDHKGLNECPKQNFKCAEMITPKEVIKEIIQFL